jgi:UrcA family protein
MMTMATPKAKMMLALLASSFAIATPAFAETRTVDVQTNDLDLSRPTGQEILQKRIDRAVRKVCLSRVQRNLMEQKEVARCEADARASADAKAAQRIAEYKAARPNLASD